MSKQKNGNQKNTNFKRNGKKGEKREKQKKIMINKGPKIPRDNSPLFGKNSPHPDKVKESKNWWGWVD